MFAMGFEGPGSKLALWTLWIVGHISKFSAQAIQHSFLLQGFEILISSGGVLFNKQVHIPLGG